MTVLFVGVEPDVCDLYRDLLHAYGLKVEFSTRYKDAEKYCLHGIYPTVLLDRGRYFELTQEIGELLSNTPGVKRVLSWSAVPRRPSDLERQIFAAHIIKPTPSPILVAALQNDRCPFCGKRFEPPADHFSCQTLGIYPIFSE